MSDFMIEDITGAKRERIALLVLRQRLRLELKFKGFAQGGAGRVTMAALKGWGFKGANRRQAWVWIHEQLGEPVGPLPQR